MNSTWTSFSTPWCTVMFESPVLLGISIFFFSQVWSLGIPRSKCWQIQYLVRACCFVHKHPPSPCVLIWQKRCRSFLGSILSGHQFHSWGLHAYHLITSQWPCLQILSHWGLGFNIYFGRHKPLGHNTTQQAVLRLQCLWRLSQLYRVTLPKATSFS